MIAVFLAPLYILVNVLIGIGFNKWLDVAINMYSKKVHKTIFLGTYILFSSSILLGFLLPKGQLKRIFALFGNYYLGILLYLGIFSLTAYLIYLFLLKNKRFNAKKVKSKKTMYYIGLTVIILTVGITILGVINARWIRTTRYDINIPKETSLESLKIVMVADMHMGYNTGVDLMSKMVDKINKEDPDVVIMAGDIFDNDYDALDYPESLKHIFLGIKSKYGVYAIHGNHDIYEKVLAGFSFSFLEKTIDKRMDEFLKEANITVLEEDGTYIADNIYVYGRPDYYLLKQIGNVRLAPDEIKLKEDDINIIVDHQPRELEELSKNNVDLDLGGHTHDGQLFPGNLLCHLTYKNSYGLKKFGNMTSIVTSGVGVFGPNMRVLTKSEITVINVTFNK